MTDSNAVFFTQLQKELDRQTVSGMTADRLKPPRLQGKWGFKQENR